MHYIIIFLFPEVGASRYNNDNSIKVYTRKIRNYIIIILIIIIIVVTISLSRGNRSE